MAEAGARAIAVVEVGAAAVAVAERAREEVARAREAAATVWVAREVAVGLVGWAATLVGSRVTSMTLRNHEYLWSTWLFASTICRPSAARTRTHRRAR